MMVKGSPALPQPAEPAGSEEVVSSTQRATPPIPPALAKAPSSQEQPETPEDSIVIHDLKAVIIKPDTPAVTQDKVHPPTSTEPTPTAGVVSSSPASEKDQPVRPTAAGSDSSKGGASSRRVNSLDHFPAMNGEESVNLDLEQTSHFELIKGRVWAWSGGKCYETPWRRLSEVELAFNHLLFLLIQRDVLLRPEAVIDLRFNLLGGAKARIGENMELEVNRSAAPRLKELLGL